MTDTVTNLLWHAGRTLGAEMLGRLEVPAPARHRDPAGPHLPPAVLEHAVRCGDPEGAVRAYDRRSRNGGQTGDPDVLLRLLERDDPEVNAILFTKSAWAALRQAVMTQARFAPGATDDTPVPLLPGLRQAILGRGKHADLQAALSATDPELAFWALVSGLPGGAHGGVYARMLAARTLIRADRRAQMKRVLQLTPFDLPPDTPAEIMAGLRGSDSILPVDRFLEAEYGPARFCEKLSGAKRTSHGRSIVRDVLEPPWPELASLHASEPLPWGAAVALLEHSRCPVEFQAALLAAHPRAVTSVARPGPDVLRVCRALGEDQLTKKVLLHGIATGSIGPEQLVGEVRPAKLALTALAHGGIEAVATQASAAGLVRGLLLPLVAEHPAGWRAVYAALPEFDGTVAELFTLLGTLPRQGHRGTELPRPGRQGAWAYAVLVDLAGAEQAVHALDFLGDIDLAPIAGSRDLPQPIADHVYARGGPVARRVLAGNPAIRADLVERLVLGGDRAIASAAYRNPRCTMPLRQYILSVDGLDAELRAELLAETRTEHLWPVLASSDGELLRHMVWACSGEFDKWARLRAAYRLAELHGVGALDGLPDDGEIVAARDAGDLAVLGARLRDCDAQWLKAITQTRYTPYRADPLGLHGALADPGLDWRSVISAARRHEISDAVHLLLSQRPDYPVELGRTVDGLSAARAAHGPQLRRDVAPARSRALAIAALADGPAARIDAATALANGTINAEEYVTAGNAADVVDAAVTSVPLARLVARLLHDGLGDTVDAWVVVALLLAQRPHATLGELVATARAAA